MKKILSIDDEPLMLTCLTTAIRRQGYEIIVTSDPDEGLRIFKAQPDICLVMLDIRMPKKNGFQIYNEIRHVRKVPVLFVTAYPESFSGTSNDTKEMWKKEFSGGTTDVIYKPFDLDTLAAKVDRLIGNSTEGM